MLFFISLAVILVSTEAKFYTDCGSKLASVEQVSVTGCDQNAKECTLKRNTNVTITVDFISSKDEKELQAVVHGVIMDLPVPFPLPQPDACKDSGLTCPIKSGDKQSYRATFPVLKSYPRVSISVKFELQNDDEEDLVCVLIPARIK